MGSFIYTDSRKVNIRSGVLYNPIASIRPVWLMIFMLFSRDSRISRTSGMLSRYLWIFQPKQLYLLILGFDLGSYVQAAKAVGNKRLIFFNTFSQILTDDWLAHFSRALSLPGVGLAGASGSWHANTSSYEGALKALFYKIRRFPRRAKRVPNAELVPTPRGRCAIVRCDAISSLLLVIFIVLLSLVVTPTRISVQTHL